MLTLNQAVKETKFILKWGGIGCATILLIIALIKGGEIAKEIISPTPPPPPTVSFGKLPKVVFNPPVVTQQLSYTIDTLTGQLPVFADRQKVYKVKLPEPNLLALDSAKERAKDIGFASEPIPISGTRYQWITTAPPTAQLSLDILSYNFDYTSEFLTNPDTMLVVGDAPTPQQAIATAQDFLRELGALFTDIDLSKTKTTLLLLTNQGLSIASSLSQANVIRVDFYQADKNKLPIFYTHPPYSNMSLFVGGNTRSNGMVIGGHFVHETISDKSATYPIKTAQAAFEELENGQAFIAAYSGTGTDISITDVSLGYYAGEKPQEYLMPIIIFQGNNGFYAYVPAITEEWYN